MNIGTNYVHKESYASIILNTFCDHQWLLNDHTLDADYNSWVLAVKDCVKIKKGYCKDVISHKEKDCKLIN